MPWTQPLTLYHGTSRSSAVAIVANGPSLGIAYPVVDFGPGFYCTECPKQASEFARTRFPQNPSVIAFEVDRERLAVLETLHFQRARNDYWSFLDRFLVQGLDDHGRPGPKVDYDVVMGPVRRNITNKTLHGEYDQISFHTDAAIAVLFANGARHHHLVSTCPSCPVGPKKPC